MKIRTGFVSNSSSSSFVVATKGIDTISGRDTKVANRALKEVDLSVPMNYIPNYLPHAGWGISANRETWIRSETSLLDYLELDSNYDETRLDRCSKLMLDLVKNGWNVAIGIVHGDGDGGDGYEQYFYHNHIEVWEDDVIITFSCKKTEEA
jgi:hypothetical protein